jgi:MinD-like ATPase involved in chromosome partitioning or flagellar assembly
MRALVLNYTGTVGKTTVASHLLLPRIPGAKLISVETINENAEQLGIDTLKLSGERFREIYSEVLFEEDVIVDVGASNIESFLEGLAKYSDSHSDFDFFIIPVTNGTKEQKETISMLMILQNYGVEAKKIKLIFNRVESSVEEEFEIMVKFLEKNPQVQFNPGCAILENELFDILAINKQGIADILSDETDFRLKIQSLDRTADRKEIRKLISAHTTRSLARTVVENLDEVYASLFNGEA